MDDIKRLKELTILYVEDEERLRVTILRGLNNFIGNIFSAQNGQEGLEIYKKESIDIIITDINMPIMDGLEMVKEIRKEDESIPVIITTAYSDVNFLKKSIDLQIDKYITKPIDMTQLLKVLIRTAEIIFHKKDLAKKDLIIRNNEKIKALGELMENVSHQWRQPLAIISMCAENIMIEKELDSLSDESLKESCDEIIQTTKNLSKVLDDFREYFKTYETKEKLELKTIIEQCYENIIQSFEQKKIQILMDLEDVSILGEKNNFLQIIYNILNNSKDALERSKDKNKLIFIELKKENDQSILSIKDNAGGIKEENLKRVFDPYFTTKHRSEGTGLNMFVIYEYITKTLNGDITVQNSEYTYDDKKYKGALFTITIPS